MDPLLVALDVDTVERARALTDELRGVAGGFKIGSQLFTSQGPSFVEELTARGDRVFLDLKFHDIPNTVAKAVAAATRLDVQMLTVHCSGGPEMLRAAEASAQETAQRLGRPVPLVLGVTVLTSMDGAELSSVGLPPNPGKQVERLAALAASAGLRGLVCSPLELALLRQTLPSSMQLVTPGIRGLEDAAGDQKRTLSAAEAMVAGANWLVIGRPICSSSDPAGAAERILATISSAVER